MIQLFHVWKAYHRDSPALSDINLQIERGEFVFLTGSSGAGKSTLLKLIFSAEQPTQGQILVNNVNIARLSTRHRAKLRRAVGVVFQEFNLLANRTVLENVIFPLDVAGYPRTDGVKRVRVVLRHLGLEHKMNAKPLRLSGGEQQRVAMARAIVNDPVILLADEPTGNLDAENTEIVMDILQAVHARGTTVVVATHDDNLVKRYAKRVVRLHNGRMEA